MQSTTVFFDGNCRQINARRVLLPLTVLDKVKNSKVDLLNCRAYTSDEDVNFKSKEGPLLLLSSRPIGTLTCMSLPASLCTVWRIRFVDVKPCK